MIEQKNYKPFIFLLIIFIIPLIASWILYYNYSYFHLKTTNHGILVKPVINVKELIEKSSQRTWRVIYISNEVSSISKDEHILKTLGQVKKALGKDSNRVIISKSSANSSLSKGLTRNVIESNFKSSDKIYLVDPDDNLFMYYLDTVNPMDILKDLKKVLEVSQIG